MIQLETQISQTPEASALLSLGDLADGIRKQPEYASLVESYQIMRSDSEAQQMLRELQAWQRRGVLPEEAADFEERLEEFYALPSMVNYYTAESAMKDLLKQVDTVISEIAGLDFAANAKRSCCGG